CVAGNPASAVCHSVQGGIGRGLHSEGGSVADMAGWGLNLAGKQGIDKNGVKTLYKNDERCWVTMRVGEKRGSKGKPVPAQRPPLFEIFQRMGLKLESQKAAVEMFIIEDAQRPSEN